MSLTTLLCPKCGSSEHKEQRDHTISNGDKRTIYQCAGCNSNFAETYGTKDVHANHLEAFNAALRRKVSAYRRKTNTYAKNIEQLQSWLDVHWILHNFVCKHFTTKEVPAVALGVLKKLSLLWSFLKSKLPRLGHEYRHVIKRTQCPVAGGEEIRV